jgi:DNA-binding transcriptional regulator YiaG
LIYLNCILKTAFRLVQGHNLGLFLAKILALMNPYSLQKTPQDILQLTAQKHRRLRKKKKFTQQALADRSGVSLGSLKRFEQTEQMEAFRRASWGEQILHEVYQRAPHCSPRLITSNSVRRLSLRPSAVSFSAMGWLSPNPLELSRSLAIPWLIK